MHIYEAKFILCPFRMQTNNKTELPASSPS